MSTQLELTKAPGGSDMETTTLVTFLLQGLREANRIELFGSWDNFTTAYPMHRDTRRGRGYWRGIHSFSNIICDGDLSSNATKQRNGALRAGGLYWYFYRLNGVDEYHNPVEPSTNNCPLLPGQTVNVLEVPRELSVASAHDTSDLDPRSVMTLNPEVRWAPLKKRKQDAPESDSPKRSMSEMVRKRTSKVAQRLSTAHATVAGKVLGDMAPLLTVSDNESCHYERPQSCPGYVSLTKTRERVNKKKSILKLKVVPESSQLQSHEPHWPEAIRNPTSDQSTRPETSSNPFYRMQGYASTRSNHTREFLRKGRQVPSRARTAVLLAPNIDCNETVSTCDGVRLAAIKQDSRTRPTSAPSSFASTAPPVDENQLSDDERLTHRMKSLRLRIACAKLRKLQTEHEGSQADTSWILNSLPNTYSGILQNFHSFQTAEVESEQKQAKHSSTISEELSQSPPQLSFSSRGSILWTPDTASLLGTSEHGSSSLLRTSFRSSMDFQVAVRSEEESESKGVDRLGVRFSTLGLDSQETIRAPQIHQVTPLDVTKGSIVEPASMKSASRSDDRTERSETHPELKEGSINNQLMEDLHFLGDSIV